jgi:hypothetical protein
MNHQRRSAIRWGPLMLNQAPGENVECGVVENNIRQKAKEGATLELITQDD